jgi:hypothetical protein
MRATAIPASTTAEGNGMILHNAELSSSQKAALEQNAAVIYGGNPKAAAAAEHQNAVLQMRYQLSLLDRSERRLSIADSMAAMLDNA